MDGLNITNRLDTLFSNKTFTTVVSLILALYAGAAAPALPNSIIQIFDTIIGKMLLIFLIGYTASKNIQIALMLAVAFTVTLTVATKAKINEGFYGLENFENEDNDMDENDTHGVVGEGTGEDDDSDDDDESPHIEPNESDSDSVGPIEDKEENEAFTNFEQVLPAFNLDGKQNEHYAPY